MQIQQYTQWLRYLHFKPLRNTLILLSVLVIEGCIGHVYIFNLLTDTIRYRIYFSSLKLHHIFLFMLSIITITAMLTPYLLLKIKAEFLNIIGVLSYSLGFYLAAYALQQRSTETFYYACSWLMGGGSGLLYVSLLHLLKQYFPHTPIMRNFVAHLALGAGIMLHGAILSRALFDYSIQRLFQIIGNHYLLIMLPAVLIQLYYLLCPTPPMAIDSTATPISDIDPQNPELRLQRLITSNSQQKADDVLKRPPRPWQRWAKTHILSPMYSHIVKWFGVDYQTEAPVRNWITISKNPSIYFMACLVIINGFCIFSIVETGFHFAMYATYISVLDGGWKIIGLMGLSTSVGVALWIWPAYKTNSLLILVPIFSLETWAFYLLSALALPLNHLQVGVGILAAGYGAVLAVTFIWLHRNFCKSQARYLQIFILAINLVATIKGLQYAYLKVEQLGYYRPIFAQYCSLLGLTTVIIIIFQILKYLAGWYTRKYFVHNAPKPVAG